MRNSTQPGSVVWPLVKAAGFWCVFAQAALILSYTLGISPVRFLYLAAAAFGLQSVFVLLGALFADGFSWKLLLTAAVCFAVGIGIFSPLPFIEVNHSAGPGWLFRGLAGSGEGPTRTADIVQTRPVDHLSAAAQLIFVKGTRESLAEARRLLLLIPQIAAEYKSAQALLHVVDGRLNEINIQNGVHSDEKAPIEIIGSEQTEHGLRVALQNNGMRTVRSIRYHVSYFRTADGQHVEPDRESLIVKDIPPHQTRTLELSDKNVVKGFIYGSFTVVNWEADPVS